MSARAAPERSASCKPLATKQLQKRSVGTAGCRPHGQPPRSPPGSRPPTPPDTSSITRSSVSSPHGPTAASSWQPGPGTRSASRTLRDLQHQPPPLAASPLMPAPGQPDPGTAVPSNGAASSRAWVPVAAGAHPRRLGAGRAAAHTGRSVPPLPLGTVAPRTAPVPPRGPARPR